MRIHREHTLGKEEARCRVEEISGVLATKYSLKSRWDGDDLRFSGSGVSGCIAVSDACVDVDVRLRFTLLLLESTIQTSIEEAMDENLS